MITHEAYNTVINKPSVVTIGQHMAFEVGLGATSIDMRYKTQVEVAIKGCPKDIAPDSESVGDSPACGVAQATVPSLPRPSGVPDRRKSKRQT